MNVGVIGSGIGGLAVASRLASAGHDVTVYEQNIDVGGKISIVQKDGFTWDGGPSFFTDPEELLKLFSDCGRDPGGYFSYQGLDEACRYMYLDKVVRGYDSPKQLGIEIERAFGEPIGNTLAFFEEVKRIYENSGSKFMDESLRIRSLFSLSTLQLVASVPAGALTKTMHDMHRKFFSTAEAVQFFDRFATYVGADARRAPGLLMCLPYLEHVRGAVQPKGGMRAIITSVNQLAEDCGVTIKTRCKVEGLAVSNGSIRGVRAGGSEYLHDAVVNAGDVANVYKWLNDGRYTSHTKREHSLSAYVMYLGIKSFTKPQYLHTILFSKDYADEARVLWQEKVAYDDPTIYINNTSYLERSHAPKDHENWFVMVNVAPGLAEDQIGIAREFVLKKLSQYFDTTIEQHIVTEAEPLTPEMIGSKYGSYRGSIYGLAANSMRGAYMRPPNRDSLIQNLYHVGVTTHPGGGIPLALRSAKIVSRMIGAGND